MMKSTHFYALLLFFNLGWAQTGYTTNFHDTTGNIDVAGSGSLQFTLPIALPPSVKTVAPTINLVYSSESTNGIAGYGWNISGISSINRLGKNIDRDGKVGNLNLSYSDFYSFNGQRLILKSGTYGRDGAEYVTEKYTNTKIKSIGSISGQVWKGPESWEITFEDGSQAWYGNTGNGVSTATTPIEYNIVKWKDNQGNYISYNYINSNNVAVISSIHWGGNESLNKPHFNSIEFIYDNRTLSETSYINDIEFKQTRILHHIKVLNENSLFKKYQIIYHKKNIDSNASNISNYEKVKEIIEYNSNNEVANPVKFDSPSLLTSVNETPFGDYNDIITNGDFNGDGLTDFIVKQPSQSGKPEGYYIYLDTFNSSSPSYLFLGSSSNFANKTLIPFTIHSNDNIIKPKNGIVVVKNNGTGFPVQNDIEIKYYSVKSDNTTINTLNNPLLLEYEKIIPASDLQYDPSIYPTNNYPQNYTNSSQNSRSSGVKEVDIDFDGISEMLLTIEDRMDFNIQNSGSGPATPCISLDPDGGSGDCWVNRNLGYRYIVIDKNDLDNNTIHITNYSSTSNILRQVMDIENDGIQDIISNSQSGSANVTYKTKDIQNNIISQTVTTPINNISIYSLTKSQSGDYFINFSKSFTLKGKFDGAIFGDLNGDKKIEILIPLHEDAVNQTFWTGWSINLNKGNTFEESFQGLMTYVKDYSAPTLNYSNAGMVDLDQDGKTEIANLHVFFAGGNNNTSTFIGTCFSEAQYNANDLNFKWKFNERRFYYNVRAQALATPIIGDFRIGNNNPKLLFLVKNTSNNSRSIISYNHFDVTEKYSNISQGGIDTVIEYKNLYDDGTFFYKTIKKEQYPYVELENNNLSKAVSQITQIMGGQGGSYRKQKYLYRGLLINLHGKGTIGFRQTARSSWFADGFENTMVWSGVEIDPLNEGIPIKEWSIKTSNDSQVFPTDISVNNNQLLSFNSKIYQIDKWYNGQIITNPTQNQKPQIVKAIFPSSIVEKNFLTNTIINTSITYGDNYFPIQSVQNINNGYSITTSNYQYQHNPSGVGNNYYIGRKTQEISTIQAYGDTKSVKEEFSYQNNLLKTLKTWNLNNSGFLLETYSYDGFGNVTQKNISNSLDTASENSSSEYDAKGRFVIKKIDNLGLETNLTYNNWGQVLTQTDTFGNTITNTYDYWGKLLTNASNLGGTTTFNYEKFEYQGGAGTKITEILPNGNINIAFTNTFKQNFKNLSKSFNQGKYIVKESAYDLLGRKVAESEPYEVTSISPNPTSVNTSTWNTITYDDSVFPPKATATAFNNGKQLQTNINGNTTSITELNGYGRTTSKTTDALGNTISSTDAGGTIHFTYNAAGQNLTANYSGNTVSTTYDVWGRKATFHDPANGTYEYNYDGLGKIRRIQSPKGKKGFQYNSEGLLVNSVEIYSDGDKNIDFEYNQKGQLIYKHGTSNGRNFSHSYEYYSDGRVKNDFENFEDRIFYTQDIIYDSFGRVQTYRKGIESNGTTTEVSIANVYKTWNGDLQQLKDVTTNKVLWNLNTTNAKGQITYATLGRIRIYNTYDTYGFLSKTNHQYWWQLVGDLSVIDIDYVFDSLKNELNSRNDNNTFNINETFTYDDNNRLINWTNPITGQMSFNEYDETGRIRMNDQVGSVDFNGNSKYQATNIDLNNEGQENYQMNGVSKLLQMITYNENNDPVKIDGTALDYEFGYGLTNSRQVMHYGQNFDGTDAARFIKYYSVGNDFEIIRNVEAGSEKHIIYIGGSPYDSNIVYIKDFEGDEGYNFLHKDYLGSILAITNIDGVVIEQRHYDAWGNFTHLKKDGQVFIGNNLKDFLNEIINGIGGLIIDRGYTSHEHLYGVELVHMNGRLYDPMLRRFLNADENIQDPYNTQNYNKYGYVMNNPLMYNDPSGEFAFTIAGLVAAVVKAVIFSSIIYMVTSIAFNNGTQKGFLKTVMFSAISAAVTYGIGSIFSASGSIANALGKTWTAVANIGTHAITQGLLNDFQGGKFWAGFAAGAFSASSNVLLDGKNISTLGMLSVGTVSGGVGSALAGGNFWVGAATGFFVTAFNYLAHKAKVVKWIEDAGYKSTEKGTVEKTKDVMTKTKEMSDLNIEGGVSDIVPAELSETKHGDYDRTTKIIQINTRNNFTLRDYVLTTYHELRHHYFFYKNGLYAGMRDSYITENGTRLRVWDAPLTNGSGLNYNEYQAHKATEIINGGPRDSRYDNVGALRKILSNNGYNVISLDKIFIKFGGFYPTK